MTGEASERTVSSRSEIKTLATFFRVAADTVLEKSAEKGNNNNNEIIAEEKRRYSARG